MLRKVVRTFLALLGVFLLGAMVVFYTAFNGNPVKVYVTRVQVQNYLETTYPDVKFTNVKGLYNFKTGRYAGRAHALIEPPVDFYIDQYPKGHFTDNLVRAKLDAQAKAEFVALAASKFPGKKIRADLFKDPEDNWPLSVSFSKDLGVELYLDVRWSGPVISKDHFVDEVLAVHEELLASGYKISGYFFSYSFPPEPESFVLSLKGEELHMTRAALLRDMHHFKK